MGSISVPVFFDILVAARTSKRPITYYVLLTFALPRTDRCRPTAMWMERATTFQPKELAHLAEIWVFNAYLCPELRVRLGEETHGGVGNQSSEHIWLSPRLMLVWHWPVSCEGNTE